MTVPTPNAELAYAVLDQIDAHPLLWEQEVWVVKAGCDTAACFAGWACLLAGDEPGQADDDGETDSVTTAEGGEEQIRYRAADLLGVPRTEGYFYVHHLFDTQNTREDLGLLVAEIFGPRPEPQS